MRESGFDVTFRFGPFGAATHHFAPVCLNSLLYKTEKDMERMSMLLGHPEDAENWKSKADERRKRMMQYFWDASRGLFFRLQYSNSQAVDVRICDDVLSSVGRPGLQRRRPRPSRTI